MRDKFESNSNLLAQTRLLKRGNKRLLAHLNPSEVHGGDVSQGNAVLRLDQFVLFSLPVREHQVQYFSLCRSRKR